LPKGSLTEHGEEKNAAYYLRNLSYHKDKLKFIIPTIVTIWFGYENDWDKGGMAATFAIVF